ncbi:sulfotransferase family 2 domain-containing protein [Novosphingobium lentum]|uniref:sulfotransferase family 2 domain-containing protein n=1 Tax=Novosphingobium lentum TaxID=145287 RepID=UPI000833CBC1|nr:sulfotransferase family 2 domain-containing protein [Novosphingobium lentum]
MTDLFRQSVVKITPEHILQKIRARRRSSLFINKGVVFVHVPRTAGTSICDDIFGRFIGHFGLADFQAVASKEAWHLPRFTIARNPWDRAVSAWHFAKVGKIRNSRNTVKVLNPARYAVPAFDRFDTFVLEWLARQNLSRADGIFRPQFEYMLDMNGELSFDHIGRLENLDLTSDWLSATLARPIKFSWQNRTDRTDYQSYYTPELRDEIGRIYARDIALLDYSF